MSEQIFKTQQNYKRVNKAKLQFQSSYAVYYKQPRSSREGKPFPYKVMRYIQDVTFKAVLLSLVLFVILMYLLICFVAEFNSLIVLLCLLCLLCFQNLLRLRSQILKRVTFVWIL